MTNFAEDEFRLLEEPSRRIVHVKSGHYITWTERDWESGESQFSLIARDGRSVMVALVKRRAIDETGKSRNATLVRYELLDAWSPTSPTRLNEPIVGNDARIALLADFLSAYQNAWNSVIPQPRFLFLDARSTR